MGSIRVSRLSSDFLEDTVKPFLKASDKSLSCLSDLDDIDKNPKLEGTVIIALGNQWQENENQEYDSNVLLQFFDFKTEKWITLMKFSRKDGLEYCDVIAIVLYYDTNHATRTIVYNSKTRKLRNSKVNIP